MRAHVVVICVLVLAVTGCGEKKEKPSAASKQRLAAAPFGSEISQIDRYVFSPGLIDATRRETLAGLLDRLSARLASPNAPAIATKGAGEVAALADRVRSIPAGPVPIELGQQWIQLRNSLFVPQPWFISDSRSFPPMLGEGITETTDTTAPAAPIAGRFDLPGAWRVTSVALGGGAATNEADLIDSVWTFADGTLTVEGGEFEGEYSFIDYMDSKGKALHIEQENGGAKPHQGWLKYGFTEEGRLQLAYFEGLQERPDMIVSNASPAPATATEEQPTGIITGNGKSPQADAAPQPADAPPPGATVLTGPPMYVLTLDPIAAETGP